MGDVAADFLAAARAFRAALADEGADARRVRNAVARVYLAAVFLPSHSRDEPGGETGEALPLELALEEIDGALADAIALLEEDVPDAVWRARRAFELSWGTHAVDVLRPLHRAATHGVG
jgi:hypothetical protein